MVLLRLISNTRNRVVIWTQLADHEQQGKWQSIELTDNDWRMTGYINDYGKGIKLGKFIGGIEDYAVWISKDALLDTLSQLGFTNLAVGMEGTNQFGDEITLVATKD